MKKLGEVKVYELGCYPEQGAVLDNPDTYCPVCGESSEAYLPMTWRGDDGLWRRTHFCGKHRISDLPEDMH